MLSDNQILSFYVSPAELMLIKRYAQSTIRGGKSNIYADQEERMNNLSINQLVGQIGEYVGHIYWFGHSEYYQENRHQTAQKPYQGDGGSDVPGGNIDFKSSLLKGGHRLNYHLYVREPELHENIVYVLVLVELINDGAMAHIIGWANDGLLRKREMIGNRYEIPARDLYPLPPVSWSMPTRVRELQIA